MSKQLGKSQGTKMKPPAFGIRLSQPAQVNDEGNLTDLPYQDLEISGNRAGLLHLAEQIRLVAEREDMRETHFFPDDEPRVLRSKEFSLTISLNSDR